jgi:voltage-dependent calcium channel alpha-2/delta-3
MLVTDGVQDNYMQIFKDYNWDDLPFVNVRVFTYLIGREVSDVREVKWMACANRGYYVHLSTYAEVREEVLQYIPVMARPMVLNATQKPNPTWSPVYADVTDPKLTNWLWVNRERNRQKEQLLAYFGRKKTLLPSDEQDKKFVHQQKHVSASSVRFDSGSVHRWLVAETRQLRRAPDLSADDVGVAAGLRQEAEGGECRHFS